MFVPKYLERREPQRADSVCNVRWLKCSVLVVMACGNVYVAAKIFGPNTSTSYDTQHAVVGVAHFNEEIVVVTQHEAISKVDEEEVTVPLLVTVADVQNQEPEAVFDGPKATAGFPITIHQLLSANIESQRTMECMFCPFVFSMRNRCKFPLPRISMIHCLSTKGHDA